MFDATVLQAGIAFSPDECYALVVTLTATGGELRKFDAKAGTCNVVQAVSWFPIFNSDYHMPVFYHPVLKQFVIIADISPVQLGRMYLFDPATETVTGPVITTGDNIYRWAYDATGDKFYILHNLAGQQIALVDFGAASVTDLGAMGGASSSMAYSEINNALYGCWISGGGSGMSKFDLNTNTGSHVLNGVVTAFHTVYDSVQAMLWCGFGLGIQGVDPTTDTLVYADADLGLGYSTVFGPIFIASKTAVIGIGATDNPLVGFNTIAHSAWLPATGVTPYYNAIINCKDYACIATLQDKVSLLYGVQKICVSP